jgi:general secretion pathway protein E
MSASLSEAIAAARHQHRAGAGSVLDVLARTWPGRDLAVQLRDHAGVEVLQRADEAIADWRLLALEQARDSGCVVVRRVGLEQESPWLATEDPWDQALVRRMSAKLGRQLQPAAVPREVLQGWLGLGSGTPHDTAPATAAADGPIVGFVDTAIRSGYLAGASDIHFECDRSGVTVKHRLDGVMTRYARLDGVTPAEEVISRIKVLAQLDITERRLPQDGRFRFELPEGRIDLRVSIMPSVFGEDAVLRLLDKAQLRSVQSAVSLDMLGFDEAGAAQIRSLALAPSGLLLVTGPTGSGKTTTVYAALSEINTGLEKIVTIEDPVEYELAGVLQIPVNERKGLTFAKGLRSILRHDPDRILVGEIRDAETAEIAIQSALTGHAVFTTVHANGLTDIIGRFRHFGLDMFGFMSSLNGVVVQRLMRKLCPHCAGEREATPREQGWFERHGLPHPTTVAHGVGCPQCHGTGYKGRFVMSEVHVIDDAFRDYVTEGSPLSVLKEHAYSNGTLTLQHHAARRVAARVTTPEEVQRVVGSI